MPPLYAYYIYFFSIFSSEEAKITFIVLSSQVLLASISVSIFYKLNKIFFSQKISFYSSLLFSVFPLHLYACSQISSISLQTFLIILFLYYFLKFTEKNDFKFLIAFSFLGGLLMLLRGESIAIVFLSSMYLFFFFKIPIKNIFIIFLITLVTISPYLIRNIIIFEKATIIKSFGYNFWRGNHPEALKNSLVEGSELRYGNLSEQIHSIPKDNNFRFNYDKLFLSEAIKNIGSNPIGYIIFSIKKGLSFLLINAKSMDPKYFNPFNYLPLLVLGITSLIGIGLSDKKSYKFNFLIMVFFIYVMIFSAVAILPRYKLIILPLQIIFTNVLIERFKKIFFNHKKVTR